MNALLLTAALLLGADPEVKTDATTTSEPTKPEVAAPAPVEVVAVAAAAPADDFDSARDCGRWRARGLNEGPVAVGYAEADLGTGRRVCPRTEIGLGGRFGAIIDTPDFYGAIAAQGVLYGSYALRDTTELFGTLEFFTFTFAQNAVLTSTQMTLGNATVGATQVLYRGETLVAGVTLRALLPTSFEVPGSRALGAELGANASWRPLKWLEGHAYLGSDFTLGVGRGPALPRGGATLIAGVALAPFDWFALVVDVNGHLGPLSYLAPAFALRFKIASLGIDLNATLPLAGTDRRDFIAGLRLNWRI